MMIANLSPTITDDYYDDFSSFSQDSIILERQFRKVISCVKDNRMLVQEIEEIKKLVAENWKRLNAVANIDPLTGLHNRRFFDITFQKEILRDARYGHDLSILLLDIDHFKLVNDEFGHLEGDNVLRWVALTLKRMIRQTDVVARFGGEEFIIMLLETEPRAATIVAEKIRAKIELESQFYTPKQITISIGIASYPHNGLTDKSVLAAADKALYISKNNGRNQVTLYSKEKVTG